MEQNDPYSPALYNLYSKKNELAEEYRTCLESKLDAEKELDNKENQRGSTYNEAIKYALDNLDKLRSSEVPLAKFLFRLYFEPNFLYSILSGTQAKEETKLYRYADLYFVAPDFAEIDPVLAVDLDYGENNESNLKLDGHTPITPPYRTSWFSANAHSDVTILKAEYRALAKKYHPDVCQHPDSNSAMQQITAEYEELLRNA